MLRELLLGALPHGRRCLGSDECMSTASRTTRTELNQRFAARETSVVHQVLESVNVVSACEAVDMTTARAVVDHGAWMAVIVMGGRTRGHA